MVYGKSERSRWATDAIWYRAPRDFITESNATHFFPSAEQPLVVQLNTIMRFALYFAIILAIVKRDANAPFAVLVLTGVATYLIHETRQRKEGLTQDAMQRLKVEERYRGRKRLPGQPVGPLLKPVVCVPPTRHNPFMNVTPVDRADFPNRPPACDVGHKDVKKRMERHYDHNLYKDVSDVFGRNASSRNFYTMPSTQIPNDQSGFAEWCYKPPPSCKEGFGSQCFKNIMPNYVTGE